MLPWTVFRFAIVVRHRVEGKGAFEWVKNRFCQVQANKNGENRTRSLIWPMKIVFLVQRFLIENKQNSTTQLTNVKLTAEPTTLLAEQNVSETSTKLSFLHIITNSIN